MSDNGTQYTSANFKRFMEQWGIQHETSSPGNSQSNGAAEAAVKVAKRLMKKAKAGGGDLYIGLLNLRNTQTEGLTTSPAQRLLGRRTKSLLPIASPKLSPGFSDPHREASMKETRKMDAAAKVSRKSLSPLTPGDTVRIQPIEPHKKEWKQASVSERLSNRSFIVKTGDGKQYRRNRRFLRKSSASTHSAPVTRTPTQLTQRPMFDTQPLSGTPTQPVSAQCPPTPVSPTVGRPSTVSSDNGPAAGTPVINPIRSTRSGRLVRTPVRFKDN